VKETAITLAQRTGGGPQNYMDDVYKTESLIYAGIKAAKAVQPEI
jgi:hypothetical protein